MRPATCHRKQVLFLSRESTKVRLLSCFSVQPGRLCGPGMTTSWSLLSILDIADRQLHSANLLHREYIYSSHYWLFVCWLIRNGASGPDRWRSTTTKSTLITGWSTTIFWPTSCTGTFVLSFLVSLVDCVSPCPSVISMVARRSLTQTGNHSSNRAPFVRERLCLSLR